MMFGAIASLATTGISAGASFYQGLRQQKLAKEAEREAGIAFAKAMNLLDVNAFENMSVNKQDIELARTAIDTRSQAMLQQAAEQGVRGIASVAGVMGQNQVASELSLLADASRREQDRQNKILQQEQANIAAKTELRLGEAEGAARAAANREDLAQGAFKSAGEGLIKGVTTALSIPKLYPEKKTTTQVNTGSATNPGKEVEIEEPANQPFNANMLQKKQDGPTALGDNKGGNINAFISNMANPRLQDSIKLPTGTIQSVVSPSGKADGFTLDFLKTAMIEPLPNETFREYSKRQGYSDVDIEEMYPDNADDRIPIGHKEYIRETQNPYFESLMKQFEQ
jgi:hypothetical protein